MIKHFLTLFLLLVLHTTVTAQAAKKQTDLQAIQELIQGSFDSIFSAHRSDLLDQYYTADFLLLEQGEIWTLDTVKHYLANAKKSTNPVVRVNCFEFIKTEMSGERAWIAYHNWATLSAEGQAPRELYWLESATAIKTEAGWRLDMLHSTRVTSKK